MSWVTVIWSIGAGACLTLALMHFAVWWKDRTARANLVFAVMAVAVAVFAALELTLMRAETPGQFGIAVRWVHVSAWVIIASLVVFVRLYLRAGRRWLAWAVVGLRTLALILNFVFSPNLTYRKITALRHVPFLGESVSVAEGVPNPWMLVAQLSLLLLLIFVTDATITVWRRNDRRQALMVGGSILLFTMAGTAQGVTIGWGIIAMPLTASLFYLGIVAAMAYELSHDVLHAARLARQLQANEAELRETQRRMDLAARAADLGIWVWDIVRDEIWVSEKERALFGFAPSEKPDIDRFRNAIHPDDRVSMRKALEKSLNTGMEYEAEHRVLLPNGQIRWLATRGRVEFGGDGKPAQMRGVSFDVTQRKLGEDALRESEQRFRVVADAAPVLIWMSDVDKLCTFFNKPWLEFTGRSLEQELGNGWTEGVHPDDLQRCVRTYVEAFDAREPFLMQYRLRRHDGQYRWISDNGVPLYDGQKKFAGYIGSCIDVTELINKERALRESEERMSLAAEAANLAVWEWDLSTDQVWTTGTHRELPGRPVSEKRTLESFISRLHIDDRDRIRQALKDAINSGEDFASEFRFMLPDGHLRWATARGRCIKTPDGKNMRFRGVSMDVTAQKDVDDLFRLATESSLSGVVLVNERGEIILVNSQAEKLFGYRREELIQKSVDVLVPERFASRHATHRAKFIAAPTTRAMGAGRELFARRKDGSEFPVEIGLNPIQTPDGIVVLTTVVDITARKMAEAEALRHREEIGHLSRVAAMGELAASIAHELNQPLSGIVSNAAAGQRFIDRGNVDLQEMRELLADISADGRRAGDVIRGVQGMVKKVAPVRQRVNLNELVTNVLQMIKSDAVVRSCELNTSLTQNLPAIEADPIQLQQVLLNLVLNAFDAMRNTPPSRRQLLIATERNGDGAIGISVRDYGVGISDEVRARLFDHFFTTKAEGLGMGLGIVRSIVESHGGTVAAENVEGGGACFRVFFPATASAS
jgi:PAS domain S-box-containing protein